MKRTNSFYGTKKTLLTSQNAYRIECKCCNKVGGMKFEVYNKYIHLISVPFFSVDKRVISECSDCNSSILEADMPYEYTKEAQIIKWNSQSLPWHYTGTFFTIAAIAVFISSIYFQKIQSKDIAKEIQQKQFDKFENSEYKFSYLEKNHVLFQ